MVTFILGFFLSLSLCADLGIVNIAIIRAGLMHGFKPALWLGLGSTIGDTIYLSLSVIGISMILDFLVFHWILWIGSTGLLLYMSIHMFREAWNEHKIKAKMGIMLQTENVNKKQNAKRFLSQGLILALSSPSSILWFVASGGSIIDSHVSRNFDSQIIYFFCGFISAGLLWSIVLAYTIWHSKRLISNNVIQLLYLLSAVLFLYFTVKTFVYGYLEFGQMN